MENILLCASSHNASNGMKCDISAIKLLGALRAQTSPYPMTAGNFQLCISALLRVFN
jgi:hypothetical protein